MTGRRLAYLSPRPGQWERICTMPHLLPDRPQTRRLLAALVLAAAFIGVGNPVAAAHAEHEGYLPVADVVEISGFLDPVLVGMMADTLESLDQSETVAVVFQVDSTASVVPDSEIVRLARLIAESEVTVSFWIGPSGARATGPIAQLVILGDDIGIAPGARLGLFGDPIQGVAEFWIPLATDALADLRDATVGYDEAVRRGIARPAPVLLEQLAGVPGFEVVTVAGEDGDTVQPVTTTRFRQLDVIDQFFHTVASPAVTYLLLLIGMGLLLFELYTAGVGIAGAIGAGCFLLSTYGLGVLPARGWALALLVVAMLAYAIDVQAGVPRLWSVVGTVTLVAGSVFLFDGPSFSWITLLVGVIGTVMAMVGGMPTMVRTRFSTPTIGRGWMIGETGSAVERLAPNGTVTVREAVWRASTNRATPLEPGDEIRVVAVDGLWLEVEPIQGAARDYRSRDGGS